MSIHISIDPRKEIKKRIELKDQLNENLIDAKAEYEELVKIINLSPKYCMIEKEIE